MKKLMAVMMIFCMAGMVMVNAGDGNGGGDAALKLESSTPESGSKDVSIDSTIELKFSNNVVNMKVADGNKEAFKLLDSNGDQVSISVVMGDDQVDKDIKNDVSIQPNKALEQGETYTLVISESMASKNGSNLKEETTVEFTTAGGTPSFVTFIFPLAVAIGVGVWMLKRSKKKA